MTNQDQRYIRIARACLKAINQVSADKQEREKDVQRVYQAIDEAFQLEFHVYQDMQQVTETCLREITALPANEPLSRAQHKARQALRQLSGLHGTGAHH